jgi:cell division protein FtsB
VKGATTTAALDGVEGVNVVARLRQQLAERDEIVVALQHVIRDLRHEIDNLRAEQAYAAFAIARRARVSSN